MVVISVSLSGEELARFDDLVDHMGYESRSSAVRDALYHFVREHRLEVTDQPVDVVLTLVYKAEDGQAGVRATVHEHEDLVRTDLHQHLGERCVDLLVLRGEGSRVHDLLDELSALDDVRATLTPL